jgi:hypothetical protein
LTGPDSARTAAFIVAASREHPEKRNDRAKRERPHTAMMFAAGPKLRASDPSAKPM